MKNDIKLLGIAQLAKLYRSKELSPVETVRALLESIEDNKIYNAFVGLAADDALKAAQKSENRFLKGEELGMMDGIPYAVKDIFYTSNLKTTMASKIYKDFIPSYNSSVVDRLNSGGAVLLGKTNTHEFACNPMADISIFGPCRNPHGIEHSACGSSSGSGAALAAYLVPATLGSDTSGSVRIPAAACGVVGMRPTQGLVSRFGVFPLSYTIDAVGPMTRNVADNAILLQAMAGYDHRDEMSMPLKEENYFLHLEDRSISSMRFAIPEDFGTSNPIDDEVCTCFLNTVETLKNLGAKVDIIPPLDKNGDYEKACRALRIVDAYCAHKKDMDAHAALYTPEIYHQMMGGSSSSAADYVNACRKRLEFQVMLTGLFRQYDAIVTPTLPIVAPRIGDRIVKIAGREISTTTMLTCLTVLPSFSGFPSISIPCGFSSSGLPIGILFWSARFAELTAYQAAFACEKAIGIFH